MKAVSGFRLDSEAKFSSYAYAMIEGEIKHHLRDTALVKRLLGAQPARQGLRGDQQAHSRSRQATAIEELADEVNVTPEGMSELMKLFCDTDVLARRRRR